MKMGLAGSVSKGARRVRDSLLNKERTRDELKIGIAGFYDRSSKLWEDVWGEVSQWGGEGPLAHQPVLHMIAPAFRADTS